jgi:hypothetical protein
MTRWQFWSTRLTLPVFAALVGACGGDEGTNPPPPAEDPVFPANYAQAYTEVRNLRFSSEHDGHYIRVHCSPGSATEYTAGTYPLPEGTVLVKSLYNDPAGTVLDGFAVMQKRAPGTAPSTGDWYWQSVDATRNVVQSGQITACISCHTGCTNNRDLTCTDP